jgi:predicted flap endonuclease-1-like 5' DNA nuclease
MPNTAHIVETALLILAAYLIGCVIGYLARRATQPRRLAQPATATTMAEPAPSGAPLVTAPAIAPLPGARRRSAAERLAAAAGRSPVDGPVSAATGPSPAPVAAIQPAAESVIILPPPSVPAEPLPTESPEPHAAPAPVLADETPSEAAAPPVEPELAVAPVVAAEVPPIDEAMHVVEPAAANVEVTADPVATAPEPEVAVLATEPEAAASPPEPPIPATRTALEDPEKAAMQAIEGNWTPPPAIRATTRPVPHPEQAAAAAADVDDAMETARSAVAAAAAAAAAAIAEAQERPRRPAADGLSFEQRSEQMAKSFLADTAAFQGESDPPNAVVESIKGAADDDALPADPASGLDFEPPHAPAHQGFGRPEALPEPLGGGPDNLKQIKGITPALEASLHGLGIFHFDQIAGWDQKAVVWVDNHLSLRGRIGSEKWIERARELSKGKSRTPRPIKR